MTIHRFLMGAVLAAALPVALVAQPMSNSPGFYSVACVKVKPGQQAEFNRLVNGDFYKAAQSLVDAGTLSTGMLLRTIVPAGSEAECDYTFVDVYPNLPTAPMTAEETAAMLRKAGISSTVEQWRQEHEAVATLVYDSIGRTALHVGTIKKGDYIVVNDMKVPDIGSWVANEKKLWQPIFESGVKDGEIDGWFVDVQFMPRGAKDRHLAYTVDVYPNWKSAFTFFGPSFPDRWKSVHPDVPIAEGMTQERKMDTIEHTTLFQVVGTLQTAK